MRGGQTRIVRTATLGRELGESHELLVTIYGASLGSKTDLLPGREKLTIGRDPAADISLEDDSVSRMHCQFLRTESGWTIEDLGSTNGTYVSGVSVQAAPLRDGELVKVGSTIFKYLSSSNVEAAYHEEIYRMAIFDGLTQIHNRRYFEEFAEREIARSQRHGRPVSLLLFDVDHFKGINDRHGHLTGDYVLRELAVVVRNRVRREELFARYAGDEFVIVLPESAVDDAAKFGEHIRQRVNEAQFVFEQQSIKVSVSMGVAEISKEITTPTMLVSSADAALYRAKERGRNCVAR
ncbi:MAG: GGDEF domain-containing protein [Myxococcales bacterium]|nr:GGDEF domain-containing protein [Myxococcales bacterium]